MSVYYEARTSGRLDGIAWTPVEEPKRHGLPGVRQSCKGIRRALRMAKRLEAEERNAATPDWRRRAARRAAEQPAPKGKRRREAVDA